MSIQRSTQKTTRSQPSSCVFPSLTLCWFLFLLVRIKEKRACEMQQTYCLLTSSSWNYGCYETIVVLMNRPSLTDTIPHGFTLSICGRPCHLFSFTQCFWDVNFLSKQLVYSVMKKICGWGNLYQVFWWRKGKQCRFWLGNSRVYSL